MKRRKFLHEASLAITGASLPKDEAKAATPPIRVGVITDATGAHLDIFLRALASCDGVERVALSTPAIEMQDRARRLLGMRGGAMEVIEDARLMVERFRPRLTIITQEPREMPASAAMAVDAGSHVLLEKPGCSRPEQIAPVAAAASARGLDLMLALPTRFSPPCQKARQLIAAGALGRAYGGEMHWVADQTRLRRPSYHKSWMASKQRAGGGKLAFHGIHYLELIEFLTASHISRITALCANVGGEPMDVEDAAVVSAQLDNGAVVTLNTGYYLDKGYANSVEMWGSQGRLRFDLPDGTPLEWYTSKTGLQRWSYERGTLNYDLMVRAVVESSRGAAAPFMTTSDSVHVIQAVFAAYKATETGMTQTVS